MTEPETRQPVPEIDRSNSNANGTATDTESTVVPEAEVPPEPWTPERVFQWNAYYDVYVMWATLLLAFLVSCNYVTRGRHGPHRNCGAIRGLAQLRVG
jgi:hypothetical protein